MRLSRLVAALAWLASLSGLCGLADAQDNPDEPARIAMFHDGGESHDSGQMRRAAESFDGLVIIDEFAPGKGNPTFGPEVDLTTYDLVFIDASDGAPLSEEDLSDIRSETRLVVLNPDDIAKGNVSLEAHPDIARYWNNRSVENDRALAAYLAVRIVGRTWPDEVPAPVEYPRIGLYHAGVPRLFENADHMLEWYRARKEGHAYDPDALTVGIVSHRSDYQKQTTDYVDALVNAVEARGHNAFALLYMGGTDLSPLLQDGEPLVDVVLFTGENLNIKDIEAGVDQARQLGVPVLSALNYYAGTEEDYRETPGGLAPGLTPRVVAQEREGVFEPMVVSAKPPSDSARGHQPIPDQVDWRVERALGWARLRRLDNADKKLVLTFWSEAGGKSDVGGDPDDFLDVPGTLATLLPTLRERGYDVGEDDLPDSEAFANLLSREISNVGGWAPGELEKRVESGAVALLPESEYLEWYAQIPEKVRANIEAAWGPPPGEVMVHTGDDGARSIVIPRADFGNIVIAPHPMWGYLENEDVLLSKDALPPHHQYLAFFLWMQNEVDANAWVSLFTNITLQPGKGEGPLADDAIGVLLGGVPHIHPERLGASGGMANRRKAMAATPGWYNIVAPTDAHLNLARLRAMVSRYREAPDEAGREAVAPSIREEILAEGVDRAIGLDIAEASMEDILPALDQHFIDLERASAPWGGKILGEPPKGEVMTSMVTGMLGRDLEDPLKAQTDKEVRGEARALVGSVLDGENPQSALKARYGKAVPALLSALRDATEYATLLRTAPREVSSILEALEGGWLEPGPMGEPYRRPSVLPPGRAIYMLDPNLLPSKEAEDIGKRQAEAAIEAHRAENGGTYPDTLAFVLWTSGISKDNGVTEAEILHLLGTRVTRNWRGEITGVELIPREELGRPRVDVLVTTSGVYRDHYPEKADLITEAARLAAASPEADNPVRTATEKAEEEIIASGEKDDRARQLASARVFSAAPGGYGPGIQFLAKSGDQRGGDERMADLYTRRMGHAYGGGLYGDYAKSTFEEGIKRMDGATMPRNSDVNGLLDHPMTAAFLGGLNLARKDLTGEDVSLYVSNLRDLDNPRVEQAAKALQTELRSRYFNPEWLKENQSHGYDGARNFMFLTDHLDLWDSTADQMVASEDWAEVKNVFIDDKFDLDMDAFFDRHNPYAHQMVMTNLLGAAQRGDWDATPEDLAQLARRLTESVMDHGPACEANQCRNEAMTEFVGEALGDAPDAAPLLAGYQSAIAEAVQGGSAPGSGGSPEVTGRVMEEVTRNEPHEQPADMPLLMFLLSGGGILLFGFGWFRRGAAG